MIRKEDWFNLKCMSRVIDDKIYDSVNRSAALLPGDSVTDRWGNSEKYRGIVISVDVENQTCQVMWATSAPLRVIVERFDIDPIDAPRKLKFGWTTERVEVKITK